LKTEISRNYLKLVILGVNLTTDFTDYTDFWGKNGVCRQSKATHWGKSCAKLCIFSAIFCRILQTAAFFLQFFAEFCKPLRFFCKFLHFFAILRTPLRELFEANNSQF